MLSRIGSRGRRVKKSGRRHISTSGLVSSALATLVLPCSGPHGRRIADSRLKMLPMRKSGVTSRNLSTGSGILKPEVLSKVTEKVGNVVKLTIFRKIREKVVEVEPEVVVYFGLLLVLTQVGVAESEKRVAAIFLLPVWALEPPKRCFLPYSGSYGCLVADRRPTMSRNPRLRPRRVC